MSGLYIVLTLFSINIPATCGAGVMHKSGFHKFLVPIRFSDFSMTNERSKRATFAQIGEIALKAVLKGTTHIYSDGLSSVFLKNGGFHQALKDFEAAKPTKVRNVKRKKDTERMTGRVGDKRIILERNFSNQSTKLIVEKLPASFRNEVKHDLQGDKIIIYSE